MNPLLWAERLLDFCYPARCACCESDCPEGDWICDPCRQLLQKLEASPACLRCGMPLAESGAPCPYCMGKGLSPFGQVLRLGVFREPLRDLVHKMKYNRRWPLGEQLAQRLLQQQRVRELVQGADGLVPVPLHWWRQIGRGYNQAEVIARHLGRRCRIRTLRPAARLRNTPTQTAIRSRAEREENLRGAFGLLRPAAISGRRIIVVDDVMTSGATLRWFGRVLKEAKPASLDAIVVAVADPRGGDFQGI